MLCGILEQGYQSAEHVRQNRCIGRGNNKYQELVTHIVRFASLVSKDDADILSKRNFWINLTTLSIVSIETYLIFEHDVVNPTVAMVYYSVRFR